jgi:hypothetical protein
VGGPDRGTSVRNVTFQNVLRHGQLTLRTSPAVTVRGFTFNILFMARHVRPMHPRTR